MNVRDVVLCEPLRSPVGRFGGALKGVRAQALGAAVVAALVERTGIDPAAVDEVIAGHCYPSMDAPAIGRVIALDAGLPLTTTGLQVDRRCGSGLQAVIDGVTRVATGACDVVIAAGAESMSNASFYTTDARYGITGNGLMLHDSLAVGRVTAGGVNYPVPGGMLETAENLRAEYGISREDQDRLAVRSHQRAVEAQKNGVFDEEIVPITIPGRKGDTVVEADEHPRPDTSVESLARLRPILGRDDPAATVTAGNSSGQNDGAAAVLLTTPERAADLGLRPFGRLVDWAVAGVPAATMGIGPVPAVAKLFAKTGLTMDDMDLVELNEAFAAQALAVTTEWGFGTDFEAGAWARTNVHGSGISLGHPVGATGVRILTTLLREMARREARYGLETMCIGGGQGLAAVFERA